MKHYTLLIIILTLTACGGGGGGVIGTGVSDGTQIESNPDFISRANAVTFNQIRLYDGHVNIDEEQPSELDTSNLNQFKEFELDLKLNPGEKDEKDELRRRRSRKEPLVF